MDTFREQRASAFYGLILDADAFAEVVTLRQPGRSDRQLYAKQVENTSELLAQEFEAMNQEMLLVRVGRNEQHEKGGIADPQLGMSLLRTGDPQPFSYTGRIEKQTAHSWTLVFARPRQVMAG